MGAEGGQGGRSRLFIRRHSIQIDQMKASVGKRQGQGDVKGARAGSDP